MKTAQTAILTLFCCLSAGLHAQQLKPQTLQPFECYVQGAESQMEAQKNFLRADSDPAWNAQLLHNRGPQTVAANGSNPHKIPGAQLYDWVGGIFIPGATVQRLVRMLQDYDHRDRYFPEVIASSKLQCRTGDAHFGFSMRLKEPSVMDADNDVVWEQVDPHRWRCRSYSTQVREVEKAKGYLLRLYSYWRFAETEKGVYVEGQTITLSGEFGSFTRALGSMIGISPEKSLKRSLTDMRDSVLKPGLEFAAPPSGLPQCPAPYRPAACSTTP